MSQEIYKSDIPNFCHQCGEKIDFATLTGELWFEGRADLRLARVPEGLNKGTNANFNIEVNIDVSAEVMVISRQRTDIDCNHCHTVILEIHWDNNIPRISRPSR